MTDVAAAVAAATSRSSTSDALHEWVVAQRWFGSKSREVVADRHRRGRAAARRAAAARARARRGALRRGDARDLPGAARAAARRGGLDRARDRARPTAGRSTTRSPTPRTGRELLHRDAARATTSRSRTARCASAGRSRAAAGAAGSVDVRPVGVEQSNSSIVFGDELILKAFRRVEPGVNPELELLRFLSARGFPHIAPLAGWYEVEGRQIDATLGILQEYLAGARDGWELALDELAGGPERAARPLRRARRGHRRAAHARSARSPTTRRSRPTSRAWSRSRC